MSIHFTGWIVPETCKASNCHIKQPLLMAEMSPNLLLILIHSSVGGNARRSAIRKTWLSHLTNEESSGTMAHLTLIARASDGLPLSASIVNEEVEELQ